MDTIVVGDPIVTGVVRLTLVIVSPPANIMTLIREQCLYNVLEAKWALHQGILECGHHKTHFAVPNTHLHAPQIRTPHKSGHLLSQWHPDYTQASSKVMYHNHGIWANGSPFASTVFPRVHFMLMKLPRLRSQLAQTAAKLLQGPTRDRPISNGPGRICIQQQICRYQHSTYYLPQHACTTTLKLTCQLHEAQKACKSGTQEPGHFDPAHTDTGHCHWRDTKTANRGTKRKIKEKAFVM